MDTVGKSVAVGKSGRRRPAVAGGEMLAIGEALMWLVVVVEDLTSFVVSSGKGRSDDNEREGRCWRREEVEGGDCSSRAMTLKEDEGSDKGSDDHWLCVVEG
ncbi:hypothetical protein B296_00021643 [Ensete ventricosum]|uniref:Uncharacterized protein n=1 Tax=Ensete ventricosum TaxID=4639 RepID=A0A426YX72_ENSVE|nr:hypothetical protein B296_00021643 [Ensete ventricosum]